MVKPSFRYQIGSWKLVLTLVLWVAHPSQVKAESISASASLMESNLIQLDNDSTSATANVTISIQGTFSVSVDPAGAGSAAINLTFTTPGGPPLVNFSLATTGGMVTQSIPLTTQEIEIPPGGSFVFGYSERAITSFAGPPGGAEVTTPSISEIVITKVMDVASPRLEFEPNASFNVSVSGSNPPQFGLASVDLAGFTEQTTSVLS
jgi:hypothetical protein